MWTLNYTAYIAARFLCVMAMQTLMLVLSLALYDLTRNPFYLGVAGLMIFIPALLLVTVTGLAADRLSRKGILVVSFTIVAAVIGVVSIFEAQGALTKSVIFLSLAIVGVARAFYNPTIKAILVNIVPREVVPRAIAFNTLTGKTGSILGPIIGGLLYAAAPLFAYLFCAVAFFVAAIAALMIRRTSQARPAAPARISDLILGFRTILADRVLFAAMTLDLMAVLLGGATALLPVYAATVLFVGPEQVGILRAAPAMGTFAAAILLFLRPMERKGGAIMLTSIAGYGLCIVLFGLSTSYLLSCAALVMAGAFDMVSIYVRENLIQLRTPDAMRGRVNAINSVFNSGANELGDFRAGAWAALAGAVPAVVFGGLCSVGVAAIWNARYPELGRLHKY